MDYNKTFAKNMKYYMDLKGKSRRDVCDDLGFSYSTLSEWLQGKKLPRMDKVEKLATYFGIQKSDLIEEKRPDVVDIYSQLQEWKRAVKENRLYIDGKLISEESLVKLEAFIEFVISDINKGN